MVNAIISSEGRWRVALGIPIAGLLWSLATLLARIEEVDALGIPKAEAFFYISLGGIAQTLLLWVGFSFVLWAMARAFGGSVALMRLMALVSRAAPGLWAGGPAAAFWNDARSGQTAIATSICLVALALFLRTLAHDLATELGWPALRAAGAITTASVFLASFAFLAH